MLYGLEEFLLYVVVLFDFGFSILPSLFSYRYRRKSLLTWKDLGAVPKYIQNATPVIPAIGRKDKENYSKSADGYLVVHPKPCEPTDALTNMK